MREPHDHTPPPLADPDTSSRPPKQEREAATTDIAEVAPGVLRTQLPVSMPGLGHVNCYVMEDDHGIAVVDPGLPGAESWAALVDRLERAGYRTTDVHTVVVTHSHADHFGGAIRLCHEYGAELVSHETFRNNLVNNPTDESEDSAELAVNSSDEQLEAVERWLDRPNPWGGRREGPSDVLARMRTVDPTLSHFFEPLTPTQPLIDGQTVQLARREWVAIHTPGHTFDHLCLYDPEFGVVFTGDHVLPSITPHIGGVAPLSDPLSLYFDSLARTADIADVSVALPAHGHPFTDLRGRSQHIVGHHADRLEVIRTASARLPNGTVNDFMRVLFRERSWGALAESETFAHLEHLRVLGEFERTSDENGFARYRRAA